MLASEFHSGHVRAPGGKAPAVPMVPTSSPASRLERFSFVAARVLPSTFFLWVFFLGCTHLWSFELFAWLQSGRWILEHGSLPLEELFVVPGQVGEWPTGGPLQAPALFGVLLSGIHEAGGWELVSIARGVFVAAALAACWVASGPGLASSWKALLWFLPALAFSGRALEGPGLLSWLCLGLQLALLARSGERPHILWWVPLIQVIWANSHELSWIGPLLVLAFAVDGIRRRGPSDRSVGTWLAVFAVTVGACFATPHGLDGVLFPWFRGRAIAAEDELYLDRFAMLRSYVGFHGGQGLDVFVLLEGLVLVATLVSFVVAFRRGLNSPLRAVLFAGALMLALAHVADAAVFSLVAGFCLVSNVSDVHGRELRGYVHLDVVNCSMLLSLLFAILLVPSQGWSSLAGERHRFGFGEDPSADRFPLAACRFAQGEGMPSLAFTAPLGVASVFSLGGGERRVFADARPGSTSRRDLERYFEILGRMDIRSPDYDPGAPWEDELLLANGHHATVILGCDTHLMEIHGLLASPRWVLVHADRKAAVFLHHETARALGLGPADPTPLLGGP